MEVRNALEQVQGVFANKDEFVLQAPSSPLRLVSHSPLLSEKMPSLSDPFFRKNIALYRQLAITNAPLHL